MRNPNIRFLPFLSCAVAACERLCQSDSYFCSEHTSECGVKTIKEYDNMPDGQSTLEGKKNDSGKPKLGLVSTALIWAIATIMTEGAKKYGEHNWRKGMLWSRPYDALQRHLTAWWAGEGLDAESGKSHLWHAACELQFLVEYEAKNLGQDDRYRYRNLDETSKGDSR